jgi:hypothetical protein
MRLKFWMQAREALEKTGQFASLRSPHPRSWFDIALGRVGIWMSLTMSIENGRTEVKINLLGDNAVQAMDKLFTQRETFEREIGAPLEWNPYPGLSARRPERVRRSLDTAGARPG